MPAIADVVVSLTLFALLFVVPPDGVSALKLNVTCDTNAGCEVKASYCDILSPTCGGGTCQCIPGYGDVDGQCKRKVLLGFSCNADSDVCLGGEAECLNNRCTCKQGYKQGLKGYDCISNLKSERYNAKCFDSVQCYYNMVCIENRCQCYPGFKQVGDYDCSERQVGDSCAVNDDCGRAPNTACLEGICQCVAGFKRVSYYNADHSLSYICMATNQKLRTEGEVCNLSSVDNPIVCQSPYVCMMCSSSKTLCARPTLVLSNARRVESFISFIVVLVVSLLVFDC